MIDKIINILENDGIIAIPTDTIYGLIGNPESKLAVEKVYKVKNRDYSKKLSIFLNDRNKIKDICITNEKIDNFIQNELKNNTIILEKRNKNYLNLISNEFLGIRIPDNKFLIELLTKYQKPVFATSVNISGEKPCLTYQEVFEKFNDKVDLIVQNDTKCSGVASKIYRLDGEEIMVVR